MKKINKVKSNIRTVDIELDKEDLVSFIFDSFNFKYGVKNSLDNAAKLESFIKLGPTEAITNVNMGIQVPGGGDYSNMFLDVDNDTPFKVTVTIEELDA
jgi:hypothetical protein